MNPAEFLYYAIVVGMEQTIPPCESPISEEGHDKSGGQ